MFNPEQCDFVSIFQRSAYRQTKCQTRDPNAQWFQKLCQIHGSCIAFYRGIRGHDDLFYIAGADAPQQLPDAELVRCHPVNRGDQSVQHVVYAAILSGAFQRGDILRPLYHTDRGLIPVGIGTDSA